MMENYARFYAALNRMPYSGDREELKEQIVKQFTLGRTVHLREMTESEYYSCCDSMERMVPNRESVGEALKRAALIREKKKCRSMALHQMQLYGVDTADWGKVNEFCRLPRIAGKEFRELDCEELRKLTKKMRAINSKKEERTG